MRQALYEITVSAGDQTVEITIWDDGFENWPTVKSSLGNFAATNLGLPKPKELGRDEALFFALDLVVAVVIQLPLSPDNRARLVSDAQSKLASRIEIHNRELANKLLASTPKKGLQLRMAGLVPTKENISKWGSLDAKTVLHAIDRGFTSEREFLKYGEFFKDYDEVLEASEDELVLRLGDFAPEEIQIIQNYQVKPETAVKWRRAGIQFRLMKAWFRSNSDFGSLIEDPGALQWALLGFNPNQVESWRDAGLALDDAREYLTPDFVVEDALLWVTNNYTLDSAATWVLAGVLIPSEAKSWEAANIFPSEVEQWVEIGLNTPNKAKRWKKIGIVTPNQVSKWRRVGLTKLEDVAEWSKFFRPDEAASWIEAGVEPKVAARRAAAGVRP